MCPELHINVVTPSLGFFTEPPAPVDGFQLCRLRTVTMATKKAKSPPFGPIFSERFSNQEGHVTETLSVAQGTVVKMFEFGLVC